MKIIYFLQSTSNSGGMERIIISKANWFASKGNQVIIITTEQKEGKDYFKLNNVDRIDLNINFNETFTKIL